MGLVIMTGLAIGTLFILFVVPAMYLLLGAVRAREQSKEQSIEKAARELDKAE